MEQKEFFVVVRGGIRLSRDGVRICAIGLRDVLVASWYVIMRDKAKTWHHGTLYIRWNASTEVPDGSQQRAKHEAFKTVVQIHVVPIGNLVSSHFVENIHGANETNEH